MAGILDDPNSSMGPMVQAGLLDLLQNNGGSQVNPWLLAGNTLSAFSKNYMSALADPRTRGMALGAGAVGAGDAASSLLLKSRASIFGDPNATPDEKLSRLVALSTVAKNIQPKDASGQLSELQKLSMALENMAPDDPKRAAYQKRVDWLTSGESRQADPEIVRLQAALGGMSQDDPRRKPIEDQIFKLSHFDPKAGVNVKVNAYDPTLGQTLQTLLKGPAEKTQNNIMDLSTELTGLDNTIAKFDESYSRLGEKTKQTVNSMRDWASDIPGIGNYLKLDDNEKKSLQDYSSYQSALGEYSAQKIHNLYGAALSAGESARADTFIPSPNDAPSVVKAKLLNASGILRASIARQQFAARKGISISDPEGLAKAVGPIETFIKDPALAKLFAPQPTEQPNAAAPAGAGVPPPAVAGPPPAAPPPATSGAPSPPNAPGAPPPQASPDQLLQQVRQQGAALLAAGKTEPSNLDELRAMGEARLARGEPEQQVLAWVAQQRSKLTGATGGW